MRAIAQCSVAVIGLAILATAGAALAADMPEAPKVSAFAPVKDLSAQVASYLDKLDEAVKTEAEYKDTEGKVTKDANTLILIALALGLHDEENPYKEAAPGLMKAAQELAAAKDYAAAKAGVEAVRKAAEGKGGDAAQLKWTKVASLPELMKAVPLINSRLKRNLRQTAFKRKAKDNAGDSAVLAVIAQGSMPDTSEAKNPGDAEKWYKFCLQMREASAALNKAVHDGKLDAAEAAMKNLNKSCDDCHEVFHKEAKKETE